MKELDNLIESIFSKKENNKFGFDNLLDIVSEVLETMPPQRFIIKEKKNSEGKTTQFTISMIPDIEVSELGWSDVRTPETGKPVKGRERQILEAYLENIVGTTGGIDSLPDKLQALSSLAENPEQFIASETSGKSNSEKLKTVISFLVFYKTLTKIIANFNASSAGFSFESFLATLLKGRQIPASGAGTIADFVDENGVKVSLKLYQESSVEVGGSFVDLTGDLIRDEKMTYLVVMKNLKGSRETLDGILTFYRFDFTLDNVMEILKDSKAFSARCIILPLEGDDLDTEEIPEKVNTVQLMNDKFEEYLKELIKDEKIVSDILSSPMFQYGTPEGKEVRVGVKYPTTGSKKEKVMMALKDILDIEDEPAEQIAGLLRNASSAAEEDLKKTRQSRKDKIASVIPSLSKYGSSPSDKAEKKKYQQGIYEAANKSAEYYEKLSTDEKKKALLRTNGYINELQFSLNRKEVLQLASGQKGDSGGAEPSIGVLKIGTSSLQSMLDSSIAALNTDIFSVFSNLQSLSDSLNSFFAGGLEDDNAALNAIDNANAIEGKTEKIRK
jgi:hypothetical protein